MINFFISKHQIHTILTKKFYKIFLDAIIELDEIYLTKKELTISLTRGANEYEDEFNSSRYTSGTGSTMLTFGNSRTTPSPLPTLENLPVKYTQSDFYNTVCTDTDSSASNENNDLLSNSEKKLNKTKKDKRFN